jgi:hypothetical protein
MIDFEKELKNYKEKVSTKEIEEKIKKKDLTDMVDILKAVDQNGPHKGDFSFPGDE